MSSIRLLKSIIRLGIIAVLAPSAAACGTSVLGTPAALNVTATSPAVSPTSVPATVPSANASITLDPTAGGPHTHVLLTGQGFPAGQPIDIHLGPPNSEATSQSFGEAVAGGDGTIQLSFTMPGEWPDGTPIQETNIVVLAASSDYSVKATAPFVFQPLPTPTPPITDAASAVSALDAQATQAATETATNFLSWLQKDPTGNSSLIYLAADLRAKAQNGENVSMLLGIQTIYPSFQVNTVEPGDEPDSAFVRVTLNFDQPAYRVLTLIKEDNIWKISDIVEGQ